MLRSVAFLGNIISTEGVEIDPREIETVNNRPRPLNPTNIRIFLGLVGYYSRFLVCFTSIESPFNTLTQMSMKFKWLDPCERNFQILKEQLTSALVLTLLEGTKFFVLYCDASRAFLRCVLIQHGDIVA